MFESNRPATWRPQHPELGRMLPGEKVERGKTWRDVVASTAPTPAPTQAPTVSAGIADKLLQQQQQFFAQQQQLMAQQNANIVKMQEQINTLFTLVQNQILNMPNAQKSAVQSEQSTSQNKVTENIHLKTKRTRSSDEESEIVQVTKQHKATSSEHEVKQSAASTPPPSEEKMEASAPEEIKEGSERIDTPLNLSKISSPTPDREVKEKAKTSSSRSAVDRGSVVSKKKTKDQYKNVQSRIFGPAKK